MRLRENSLSKLLVVNKEMIDDEHYAKGHSDTGTTNPDWYKLGSISDMISSSSITHIHMDSTASTSADSTRSTKSSSIDSLMKLFGILDEETADAIEDAIEEYRKRHDKAMTRRIQERYHDPS
ncbi:MAG: hypothetical protein BAJATHORv1_90016 [Candidatus Thorarchaeota archaeon]|nr:MAG: hypothetical protein BAJATHORv1_90016 [Candidatus Thorarchaeota archaeon]